MRKIRVGLIFGGKSAEHEVSLQSARNILDALDPQRFEPVLIGIDKQGQWHVNDPDSFLLHADDPARIALHRSGRGVALLPGAQQQQLRPIQPEQALALAQIDVVFPIVHGTLGEDGSLQGLLRMANLPSWAPACWARRWRWTRTWPSACCAMPGWRWHRSSASTATPPRTPMWIR